VLNENKRGSSTKEDAGASGRSDSYGYPEY